MNSKLLSAFGYSKDYYLTENGRLFNAALGKEIIRDNLNRISIKDSNNKTVRIAFKSLYRLVFNKEYCKDSIKDLKGEVWKEVEGTEGRYYVSNCGRVKSLCGYTAKLL